MAVTTAPRYSRPTTFADILDKGMIIDAFVRISLLGIELVTIEATIVLASVDTYLRLAEIVNRLDLYPEPGPETALRTTGLPERQRPQLPAGQEASRRGRSSPTRGAWQGVKHLASDIIGTVRREKSERDGGRDD
jgi:hypothetical protein